MGKTEARGLFSHAQLLTQQGRLGRSANLTPTHCLALSFPT